MSTDQMCIRPGCPYRAMADSDRCSEHGGLSAERPLRASLLKHKDAYEAMNDEPTPDDAERCPRCGMPVDDFGYMWIGDSGARTFEYQCRTLHQPTTGATEQSSACERIAALTAELDAWKRTSKAAIYDEGRADAEREIVAWLRDGNHFDTFTDEEGYRFLAADPDALAGYIEQGEHRKNHDE